MLKRQLICLGLLASFSALRAPLAASSPTQVAAPTVVAAEVPLYPPLARAASQQGVVVIEVFTDGDKANSIKVLSGMALLAEGATSNLRSWRFVRYPPQTFQVTYRYRLSTGCKGNPDVKLTLPLEVSVCSKPSQPIF
jgi:hypothetical protein